MAVAYQLFTKVRTKLTCTAVGGRERAPSQNSLFRTFELLIYIYIYILYNYLNHLYTHLGSTSYIVYLYNTVVAFITFHIRGSECVSSNLLAVIRALACIIKYLPTLYSFYSNVYIGIPTPQLLLLCIVYSVLVYSHWGSGRAAYIYIYINTKFYHHRRVFRYYKILVLLLNIYHRNANVRDRRKIRNFVQRFLTMVPIYITFILYAIQFFNDGE